MALEWSLKFQKGSFRTVEFFIDSHSRSGGRQSVDHEFPEQDTTRSEDLGIRTRRFSIEGYVTGSNYFEDRDRLIQALEIKGPGPLRHPYLGLVTVQVSSFSVTESASEGRVARFTMDFSEAGEIKFPEKVSDKSGGFFDQANNVIDQAAEIFEVVTDGPQVLAEKASRRIRQVSAFLDETVNKFTQPVSELTFAIKRLESDAERLARAPDELAQRIARVFDDLINIFEDDPDTSQKICGGVDDLAFEPVTVITPTNQQEQDNDDAILNYTKQVAVANQSKAAIITNYTNSVAATEVINDISQSIDGQLEVVTDDDLFQELSDLKALGNLALPPDGLADRVTFIPEKTTPSLVIAYRLFNDLGREQEILDENSIEHPTFIAGGVALEVNSA